MEERKAIIYARVSTEKQAERELSLEAQEEICRRKAKELGYKVVKVFKEAESGRSAEKREEFLKAIDFAIQNKIDAFIVYDTSRFARNRKDAVVYKTLLRKHGVKVVYASQSIPEEDDLTSLFVEGILEIVDEYYSRKLAKDVIRSMEKNAQEGYWNGGRPPFGYRRKVIAELRGGKKKVKLEINPEEAVIVREIFETYLYEGIGAYQIAKKLNEQGKLNRGRKWDKKTILRILTNPIYTGTYRFRDIEVENFCEPIISKELFKEVQKEIEERRLAPLKGNPTSIQLLTGILRCGYCGSPMYSEPTKKQKYRYYVCSTYKLGSGCKPLRIKAQTIENAILESLRKYFLEEKFLEKVRSELIRIFEEERKPLLEKLKLKKLEKAEVEKAIENLFRLLENTSEEDYELLMKRLRERRNQLKELEKEIKELEVQVIADLKPIVDKSFNEFKEAVEYVLREGDTKIRRKLLKKIFSAIYVKEKVRTVGTNGIKVNEKNSQLDRIKVFEVQGVPNFSVVWGEWCARRDSNPRPRD